MLIASAGLFGIFLFLTYYLQQTLGYSPLVTGVAFLPISGGLVLASNLSTIVLMPRFGPEPLVTVGMLAAAGGAVWLAQLSPHTGYAAGVLGPIILAAVGLGLVIAPVINTGTFGVAPQDAGVASAILDEAAAALNRAGQLPSGLREPALPGRRRIRDQQARRSGAPSGGALFRPGQLAPVGTQPSQAAGEVPTAQAKADPRSSGVMP